VYSTPFSALVSLGNRQIFRMPSMGRQQKHPADLSEPSWREALAVRVARATMHRMWNIGAISTQLPLKWGLRTIFRYTHAVFSCLVWEYLPQSPHQFSYKNIAMFWASHSFRIRIKDLQAIPKQESNLKVPNRWIFLGHLVHDHIDYIKLWLFLARTNHSPSNLLDDQQQNGHWSQVWLILFGDTNQ
jgi:hypothetical protein